VKAVYPEAQIPLLPGSAARRPGHIMDPTLIRRDIAFAPEYDINRGVAEWIEWLKTNPN
jgi:nucleoside-diphosphate-sugar epimerase